jgi:hypothetical protein
MQGRPPAHPPAKGGGGMLAKRSDARKAIKATSKRARGYMVRRGGGCRHLPRRWKPRHPLTLPVGGSPAHSAPRRPHRPGGGALGGGERGGGT